MELVIVTKTIEMGTKSKVVRFKTGRIVLDLSGTLVNKLDNHTEFRLLNEKGPYKVE